MKELTDNGWVMFYSCMCGGSRKEHYNNPSYPGFEIQVRPTRQTFRLFSKNHLIAGPEFVYKLSETLNKFNIG